MTVGYNIKDVFNIDQNNNWENQNILNTINKYIFGDRFTYKLSYLGKISKEDNRTMNNEHGPTVILLFMPTNTKSSISTLTNKYKDYLLNNEYICWNQNRN